MIFVTVTLGSVLAPSRQVAKPGWARSPGGGYLYVKTGLKDPQGFMSGWMSWFAYVVACALYGLGFGAYLRECLPLFGLGDFSLPFLSMEKWMAVAVVASCLNRCTGWRRAMCSSATVASC